MEYVLIHRGCGTLDRALGQNSVQITADKGAHWSRRWRGRWTLVCTLNARNHADAAVILAVIEDPERSGNAAKDAGSYGEPLARGRRCRGWWTLAAIEDTGRSEEGLDRTLGAEETMGPGQYAERYAVHLTGPWTLPKTSDRMLDTRQDTRRDMGHQTGGLTLDAGCTLATRGRTLNAGRGPLDTGQDAGNWTAS